jgi:RNA polymerase sigma-70 factor (ECF subfamily)
MCATTRLFATKCSRRCRETDNVVAHTIQEPGLNRDEAAEVVNTLFDGWYDAMVRFAFRLTGSLAEAEEVVQDAFLQLFDQLCAGTAIDNPRAWTFCVVRRRATRSVQHHLKREVPLDGAELFFAPAPLLETDGGDLDRMLAVLTPREVEVVLLRLESMKYREIGAALGITANSVNVLLARALRKLRAFVAEPRRSAVAVTGRLEAHKLETLQ